MPYWPAMLILTIALLAPPVHAVTPVNPSDEVAEALVLKRQHRYQAAEQMLLNVLERDPLHLDATLQLAYLKSYRLDTQGALVYFQKAVSDHPDSLEAQVMLAQGYLGAERYEAALQQAEKTRRMWEGKDPDKVLWANLLVIIGGAQGLKIKREGFLAALKYGLGVRSTLEQAYQIDSDSAVPTYALARYYLEAPAAVGGDARKGLDLLRKAIKKAPHEHRMRAFYLKQLVQSRRDAEARAELTAYQADFRDLPAALEAIQPILQQLNP